MMTNILLPLSIFLGYVACEQPSAPSPIAAPLRELPWAQLNFLHTTDVHGWWGGHLQEPSYSADWGDYISFAKHLRDRADADGSDLLLIDTGDRVEGNGIYDGSSPVGKFTYDIAKEQKIDLICSGNHELYKANSSNAEFYHTVPNFKGNYLASNLDIYNPETGKLEPLAARYKKFTTKNQGIRILAFGFIFDFTGNANNTIIHTVEDTVKEDWFKEAIRDKELDLILVFGHVDIRSFEYATLYSTIRKARWDLPIQFFGGHSHIRDYKIYDSKSVALESGRYMETIGFMSIDGVRTGGTKDVPVKPQKSKMKFSRRYLDNNLFSLHHHSGKDSKTFPTERGVNVTKTIDQARNFLALTKRYGCAPHDLWVSRRPYPHKESIFSWLEQQVLPQTIELSPRIQEGRKALVITNTGGIRFDIFKGPFTKDTTFLVSPFTSGIRYLKDVPYKSAKQLLKLLNNEGPILEMMEKEGTWMKSPEHVAARFRPNMFAQEPDAEILEPGFPQPQPQPQAPLWDLGHDLIPGYTTHDDAGDDGDDTLHSRLIFYNVPNCIQSTVGFSSSSAHPQSQPKRPSSSNTEHIEHVDSTEDDPEKVDVMFNEFIQKWIILALEYLGEEVEEADTESFRDGMSFTEIMKEWVKGHWDIAGETCP
ncbi:ser/Thr protein phosphatase-like protein family [Amniculicola lignicola CBS 123094]|uniref:Ser/Thr protein phosphatase-like protein family n=1 Tax=Amniculicola lignicola CBS 123094 TaxID=1392246 RepID=A0A6A5X2Z9_9PLEO|nr:ser/Thr protein phosphatase-like protein family [Amniculicola lignicola CBS 123094]